MSKNDDGTDIKHVYETKNSSYRPHCFPFRSNDCECLSPHMLVYGHPPFYSGRFIAYRSPDLNGYLLDSSLLHVIRRITQGIHSLRTEEMN